MCTVIVHVPESADEPTRVLAVRDEDPARAWDPLGAWWPDLPHVSGVRDTRAGGAWLAADTDAGRLAVVLNRADLLPEEQATGSRGHVVLDAVAGRGVPERPATHGFNLVEIADGRTLVHHWDGRTVRTVELGPGVHMIAHGDVDDPETARIAAWQGTFGAPGDGEDWWRPWLDALEATTRMPPTDDRAIIRDNRPHGYPTLSLLVCAASVSPAGADVRYGELAEPGAWSPLTLR